MKIEERRCDHCACVIPRGIEYLAVTLEIDVVRDHAEGTRPERWNKRVVEVCGTTCLHAVVALAKDGAKVRELDAAGVALAGEGA